MKRQMEVELEEYLERLEDDGLVDRKTLEKRKEERRKELQVQSADPESDFLRRFRKARGDGCIQPRPRGREGSGRDAAGPRDGSGRDANGPRDGSPAAGDRGAAETRGRNKTRDGSRDRRKDSRKRRPRSDDSRGGGSSRDRGKRRSHSSDAERATGKKKKQRRH